MLPHPQTALSHPRVKEGGGCSNEASASGFFSSSADWGEGMDFPRPSHHPKNEKTDAEVNCFPDQGKYILGGASQTAYKLRAWDLHVGQFDPDEVWGVVTASRTDA